MFLCFMGGAKIPTKKSKLFTGFEGQESFWMQVLEGELPLAKDNYVVGELRLDGLQPALGNRILVEVEFDIDVPGTGVGVQPGVQYR